LDAVASGRHRHGRLVCPQARRRLAALRANIDVDPDRQIRIEDRASQRFTTVPQYFGTVGVEANREKVQNFAVRTPCLAAVVEGALFAVKTEAKVSVAAVSPGQNAAATASSSSASAHGKLLVAEGIEGGGEAEALTAMGCEHGQGWLFGRPEPAEAPQARLPRRAAPPPEPLRRLLLHCKLLNCVAKIKSPSCTLGQADSAGKASNIIYRGRICACHIFVLIVN
jgi:hypothetical protein